jgi:hypothetical protein
MIIAARQAYDWLEKAHRLSQTANILGHEVRIDAVRQKIQSHAASKNSTSRR